jgi:hypothetical protein
MSVFRLSVGWMMHRRLATCYLAIARRRWSRLEDGGT